MNKRILLFLVIGIGNSIMALGQKTTVPAKPAEKPAYAYLLATTDLDVKVTVLNTQNSYTVRTTDELVKIGLDAGDNIIKITPLDGGNDGYTVTKTADKPGNSAFQIELMAARSMVDAQQKKEEILKKFEEERLGKFSYYDLDYVETRVTWGEAADKSIEYALLPKGATDYEVEAELVIRFGSEESLRGKAMTKHIMDEYLGKILGDDYEVLGKLHVFPSVNSYYSDVWGSNEYQTSVLIINIKSTRENIIPALSRISELLRKPEFTQENFNSIKETFNHILKQNEKYDGKNLREQLWFGMNGLLDPIPKNHPNYIKRMSLEEQAQEANKVSLWDIEQFYEDFFGMTDASIAVVGDFDLIGVKNVITKQFSNWPSKKTYIPLVEPSSVELTTSDITINVPGTTGVKNAFFLPINIPGEEENVSRTVISLIGEIAGKRNGNIYSNNYGWKNGGILVELKEDCKKCDSIGMEGMLNRIKTEFNNLKLNPVTQDEVTNLKDHVWWWGSDNGLKELLLESLNDDLTLKETAMRRLQPIGVSEYQVNDAIKKYLNTDKLVAIKVGNIK